MSIICEKVDDALSAHSGYKGASKFVYATNDGNTGKIPSNTSSKCFLPEKYAKLADRIYNFEVRPDDIWIVAFPKTGTTWMQNIVWQLKNNLKLDAKAVRPWFQLIEYCAMFDPTGEDEAFRKFVATLDGTIDEYEKLPSPRIIKSHLPVHLLPKGLWTVNPKIIYMARNPKDTALSLFHYRRKHDDTLRDMNEYLERFRNGYVIYTPFHEHVLGFWQLRNLNNIFFTTYEEMSADQLAGVKRISEFLGCSYSDGQLRLLTEHVSFENMKKIKPDPNFEHCRKGKVGSFRDELSEETIQRFDEWTKEELKNSDFRYAV